MDDTPLGILQVNMFDVLGGAEKVAWNLLEEYARCGCASWLAVGRKRSAHPDVLPIRHDHTPRNWARFWWHCHQRLQPAYARSAWAQLACRCAHRLAEPAGLLDEWRGREDFHYPGAHQLLDLPLRRPDVLHCHNLHRKYFDLRALPALSAAVPTVLTLHDAWLLSGHCAHSFDCPRWRTGCGNCPDLTIHPPIRRDATARNWGLKRDIFAECRLHVATPCRWLMDKVRQSMLASAVITERVISNGVDLGVFRPGLQRAARAALDLPADARILLTAGQGLRDNRWKDFPAVQAAAALAAARLVDRRLILLALGERGPDGRCGAAELRCVPFQADPATVASYYQAADVYVHAARADTFPNTILESLACGAPVVATAVGGIPEQVRTVTRAATRAAVAETHAPASDPTGVLVDANDPGALAAAVESLLADDDLRAFLAENAAADARRRFDVRRQAADYLTWFRTLVAGPASPVPPQEPSSSQPLALSMAR